ncbi:hypothetical protein PSTT_17084 [Puccinia striiformis]|uniref:Uncharacterized protein n=1 Tax=Puccinia striiformis TaxID=27350 RepID=A0A2S4U9N7_9BASI|nr:hypothetical protein PSTT_17084 [Puccinia striiformis]
MKGLDRVASNGSDEKQRWDMKQILNAGGPCPHDVSSYRGLPNKITLRDGSSSLLPIIHSPSHISLPTRPGHSALDPTHVTGDKSTVNLGSGDQRLGSHYHVVPKWERSVHRLLGLSQPAPSTTPPPIVACYGHNPFPAAGVKVTGSYNPLPPQSMLGSGMWADQRRFVCAKMWNNGFKPSTSSKSAHLNRSRATLLKVFCVYYENYGLPLSV